MTIDLEDMSEEELIALNKQVVEQIKSIRHQKSIQKASQFKLGDMVSFAHEGKKEQGIIMRINQKTLSVLTSNNTKWSLSPGLVIKEKRPGEKIKKLQAELFPVLAFPSPRKQK